MDENKRKKYFAGSGFVFNKDNIEIIKNAKVVKLNDDNDKLSSVELNNGNIINCNAVFVNVGNVPMPIKCENLETDEGYIVVDKNMKTSVDKVYACGDIIKKDVYQISTAVGEATIAAMSIMKEL